MVSKVIVQQLGQGFSLQSVLDFINHLFGIKSDISAPIVISLVTLIIGNLLAIIIKGIAAINKRSFIKKMFFLNLTEIVTNLKIQSNNYKSLSEQMVFKDNNVNTLNTSNLYQVNILQQISYIESFNAIFTGIENVISNLFREKKKIRAFQNIWESVEFIIKWQDKPFEDLEKFNTSYNECNQSRNKALSDYFNIIEPFLLKASKDVELIEALKYYAIEIDKIHLAWQKTPNRINPFKTHRKLVLPIRILNRPFDNIEVVYNTYKPLLDATLGYTNMRELLKVYQEVFNNYSESFYKKSENISNSVKLLK